MAAASLCVEVRSFNGSIGGGRRGIGSSNWVVEDDTDMSELVNTGSRIVELVRPAASGLDSVIGLRNINTNICTFKEFMTA